MNWTNLNVAVTGGSGFIGRHLIQNLSPLCKTIRNLDLADSPHPEHVHFHKMDISSERDVMKGIHGADVVFHLSSKSFPESIQNPRQDFLSGPVGTFNVLDASRMSRVKKLVFASSFLVYGTSVTLPASEDQACHPISPYGASKLASEIYCQMFSRVYEFNTVCLRFANVYGPFQTGPYLIPSIIHKIHKGEKIDVFGTGRQTRDFVFVDDIVEALIRAAESEIPGEVFNVSSGKETSILDVIETISKISGLKPQITFHAPRQGDVERFYLSGAKAQKFLGFIAKTDIENGLRKVWEAYNASHELIHKK